MNKLKQGASSGFTIVELLIVIVVIGILAAITIVAYTGITTKANENAAVGNADAVRSVATTYQAENGTFPNSTQLTTGSTYAKLPAGITVQATAITAGSNTVVLYVPKGSSPVTGACILAVPTGVTPSASMTATFKLGDATGSMTNVTSGTPACA